jgi:hypothetical protein
MTATALSPASGCSKPAAGAKWCSIFEDLGEQIERRITHVPDDTYCSTFRDRVYEAQGRLFEAVEIQVALRAGDPTIADQQATKAYGELNVMIDGLDQLIGGCSTSVSDVKTKAQALLDRHRAAIAAACKPPP